MNQLLEITFSSFWHWLGMMFLLYLPFNFAFRCWNRWLRSRNIKEQGWPPPHCDADGDFFSEDSDDN